MYIFKVLFLNLFPITHIQFFEARFLASWVVTAIVFCHGWSEKLVLGSRRRFQLGNLHMAGAQVSLLN